MLKSIIILIVFITFIASLKPTPSVSDLSKGVNVYCKDICK
jgi:hypothetical protein